ncbi:MAG: glutamate formimidoyltransferase [Acidimicrobiales bacterium]
MIAVVAPVDLECVVNVSEGRDLAIVDRIATAGGACLLDVHTDPDHNRSVLTLAGTDPDLWDAVRAVVAEAVEHIDLTSHRGVHPRLGAADVVPFVPLLPAGPATATSDGALDDALGLRDRFACWAGTALALPCFLYGPERSLPEVRAGAFRSLWPDAGPATPHPTAGASAVGARHVLVAYNLWLAPADGNQRHADDLVAAARRIAAQLRGPGVRALGLAVAGTAQVSCNLIDPVHVGPELVYDRVVAAAEVAGLTVARAELVGLATDAVLERVPPRRWAELGLSAEQTVEARLAGSR